MRLPPLPPFCGLACCFGGACLLLALAILALLSLICLMASFLRASLSPWDSAFLLLISSAVIPVISLTTLLALLLFFLPTSVVLIFLLSLLQAVVRFILCGLIFLWA